jgi:hypothetical protein
VNVTTAPGASTGTLARPTVAVTLLTVWLVLTMGLPARLHLGQFGPPSVLMGILLGFIWLAGALTVGALPSGRQPMRTALLVFVVMLVVGYIVAVRRVLSPAEAGAATRTIFNYGASAAVALFVTDALSNRVDLLAVVRRIVWGGLFLASVGTLHGLAGIEIVSRIQPPFLTWSSDLAVGIERADFERTVGTATHPIEYGVALAVVLPFAIHLAIVDHRGRAAFWWMASAFIGSSALYSLSRSAAIGLALTLVATVVALPSSRLRQRFVLGMALSVLAVQAVSPGLLGTIRGLFRSLSDDRSYQARVVDYGVVDRFIQDDLWFGRGLGTFLPDQYALLDNQMLKLVLEVGVLGTLVFVGLFVVGQLMARTIRRHDRDPAHRDLARTVQVALAVGFVSCFTFDLFAFTMARSLLFLTLGLAGATWRLAHLEDDPGDGTAGVGAAGGDRERAFGRASGDPTGAER